MERRREFTTAQRTGLAEAGLSVAAIDLLAAGEPVGYEIPTRTGPAIAIIQLRYTRLRNGIVTVNDPGAGLILLSRFRSNAIRIGRLLGLRELELFGVEVINTKLREVLLRRGFVLEEDDCPEELGGGRVEIMTRVYRI